MNFTDWYTDLMDIRRITERTVNGITKRTREQIASAVPCRIYQSGKSPIAMQSTAAKTSGSNKLMCGIGVDLKRGDELLVKRGDGGTARYFAGEMQDYPEPFGAVMPGLAHKEVNILEEART